MLIRLAATACAAGIVTVLLAAAPIIPEKQLATAAPVSAKVDDLITQPGARGLAPRAVRPKQRSADIILPEDPISGRPQWNGKLGVKFRDELKVRADRISSTTVRGANGQPIPQVTEILSGFGGTVRQALRRTPEELRALEMRAERISKMAQADLAGIVYVDVQPEKLVDTARALNDLDIVEWVEIERIMMPDGGGTNQAEQDGCGANGPGDGTGITNCYTTSPDSRCSTLGGGQGCNDVNACTAPDGSLPACRYGCNNTNCCEIVAALIPGCNDGEGNQGWDAVCATYANILCSSTVYDASPAIQGGGGSAVSIPSTYKYDPCFAMRGPINPAPSPDVLVYGIVETPVGALTVTSQLLTYTTDPTTGAFVTGSLVPVDYPTNAPSDEGEPLTGVPQQALPDPSLEGAYLAFSTGCFVEHTFGGCNQVSCCVYVCRNDPSCCVIEWDLNCVAIAQNAPGGGSSSPCTSQSLPIGPFPPTGQTPLLTAGNRESIDGSPGNARGYQTYTVGDAVLGPFDNLPPSTPPGAPPLTYPVKAPTDNAATFPGDAERRDTSSNLGTLAAINSGYRGGGLDLQGYEVLLTQLNINPAQKGRGQGVEVAVIEHSAYVNHEDLINVVVPEPNQTQVLVISPPLDPNHGTAVLGVIGAERNNIGVTGIADGADLSFYPIVSREEGARLENAYTNALIALQEGDVINMSIGSGGGNTVVASPIMFDLVTTGTNAGITTVISAGNDAVAVITSPGGAGGDSGAVIVGACWPGFQVGQLSTDVSIPGPFPGNGYCRLNFSNFTSTDNNTGNVTLSGWGTGVTSCGYGDLFNGTNTSEDPLEVNRLRSYTSVFNGTSSAAPIISGWCARLQSFSIAWFGAPLPPQVLRAAISTQTNIHQQCGIDYDSDQMPGYPEAGDPSVGDIDIAINGAIVAPIGGFPRATNTVSWIVSNTFGGTPVAYDIICGTYEGGSNFSLRQLDGNALRIGAVRRRAGSRGNGYGPDLFYPLGGGTTDLQLKVSSLGSTENVTSIGLATSSSVSWNLPVLEVVYFYNHRLNRWMASGSSSLSPVGGGGAFTIPGSISDYILSNSTGGSQAYARVYTCGLTNSGYSVLHDFLAFAIGVDIFNPGGGVAP
ncbi:MAG: hypothetical protein DWI19_00720 [Planctomycetota bacterium]|nr:MAG: hypothetical protein DWI19_00720 [Planctomycetota bacterium]